MNRKVLLCSTGNYIQCLVINHNGKEKNVTLWINTVPEVVSLPHAEHHGDGLVHQLLSSPCAHAQACPSACDLISSFVPADSLSARRWPPGSQPYLQPDSPLARDAPPVPRCLNPLLHCPHCAVTLATELSSPAELTTSRTTAKLFICFLYLHCAWKVANTQWTLAFAYQPTELVPILGKLWFGRNS